MTAAALTPSKEYIENGVTLAYAVPFRFRAATHIKAQRISAAGIVTELTYGTDYSVTGGETDAGGTLTVSVAGVAGTRLRIRRETPRSQDMDYTTGDNFPAESHEGALDKAMLIAQEQDQNIADTEKRALRVPDGETAPLLAPKSARANRFMAWDGTGENLINSSGTGADAGLRTDLADQEIGFTLITHKRSEAGTFGRTAAQMDFIGMSGSALSVMNWIDPDYDVDLKAGTLVADLALSMMTALSHVPVGGELHFPKGLFPIGASIIPPPTLQAKLFGGGTIKGMDGTAFMYLFDFAGTSNVEIDGLTFDANKAGREAAAADAAGEKRLSCLSVSGSIGARVLRSTFKNTLGKTGISGNSSIAINASGGSQHLEIDMCRFFGLGKTANDKPSDAVFARGDFINISRCYAEDVTDHAWVLEGCNNSAILNNRAKNCTSIAAISNDVDGSTARNNIVSGNRGTSNYLGSFGGMIGAYTFGTAKLRDCHIHNNILTAEAGAGGGGPGAYFFGNMERVDVHDLTIHGSDAADAMTHGVIVDTLVGRVGFKALRVKQAAALGTCVRLLNGSSGATFDGSLLEGGVNGFAADGASSFVERDTQFIGNSGSKISISGGASYYGTEPQTITPTVSSNVGNATATFEAGGQPVFNVAKARRRNNYARLEVYLVATIKAGINAEFLDITLPSWMDPLSSAGRFMAEGLYGGTPVMFMVRPLDSEVLRLYRAGGAGTFDASGGAIPIEVFFDIDFEVTA